MFFTLCQVRFLTPPWFFRLEGSCAMGTVSFWLKPCTLRFILAAVFVSLDAVLVQSIMSGR